MVRVRYARDRVVPYYIDPGDESWRVVAENLLDMYRLQVATRAANWSKTSPT